MTWNIIGHTWASDLLARHVTQGTLRHAYLITGPSGVGRRTLALRLAQTISCTAPLEADRPCLTCKSCERIGRMQHPDLTITQAEQVGGVLKVEQIRELQHSLALAPYEAPYRIAILLRFEEAHLSAANALLKTLEEPNPQVVLILTAESAERLLPTIVSRCEILRLRQISVQEIMAGLITRGVDAELARLCAHISGGLPGYALRLAEDEDARVLRRDYLADLYRLCGASRVERFDYVQALVKNVDKEALGAILQLWGSFWHDIVIRSSGASAAITNLDFDVEINAFAGQIDFMSANRVVSAIDQTMTRIRENVNSRLSLEVLLLDLPRLIVSA